MRVDRVVTALFVVFLAACGTGDPVSPENGVRPPMPMFAENNEGCAVWSCISGECPPDPVQYGACCTELTESGTGGVPKPASCDLYGYCALYPSRCPNTSPTPGPNGGALWGHCLNISASSACSSYNPQAQGGFNPCTAYGSGNVTWFDFPECIDPL